MRRTALGLLCAIVAVLATATLASRGDDLPDLPPGAVARVGNTVMTKAAFDRAAERAPRTGGMRTSALRGLTYDPPDYSGCVAAKQDYPAPAGEEKEGDERLKDECKSEFEGLMPSVMESLLEAEWFRQAAKARGIGMSKAEVDREVEDYLKREGFSERQNYEELLRVSGMTREDLLADIQVDLLEDALTDRILERASKVSSHEIEELYRRNGRRLTQPERRDLSIVLTRTKAQADEAKAALQRGASWAEVAKRHSVDATSRRRGGKLSGVTQGEHEKELTQAAFNARKGVLEGPVKTPFGWYVFEVTKIIEAGPQAAEQAKRTIERRLRIKREQNALARFDEELNETYRARTVCADEFKVPDCGNGP